MAIEIQDAADRMARAEDCFRLSVIDKKSYREISKQLGISPATVSRDIAIYKAYLADERKTEDIEQRRAKVAAMIDDIYAKALEIYDRNQGTGLTQVGALNTIVSLMAHLRAVTGVDMPKEIKAEQDTTVSIKWED